MVSFDRPGCPSLSKPSIRWLTDRKSTRLNSSHGYISYAVFCLKKKMAQRISTVEGVAQMQVYGSQKYAVRIQLDPQQLAARSLGIYELVNAIRNNNVNLPTVVL